jgi:hypothetical protein
MTRDNAHKKDIRARMAETGESYATAKRKLEAELIPVVWELGEDGDSFFVEHTTDVEQAKALFLDYVAESRDNDEWKDEIVAQAKEAEPFVAEDWFWTPYIPGRYDEDLMLYSYARNPEKHNGEPFVKGCYFSV